MISCRICNAWTGDYLGFHLKDDHQMSLRDYALAFPNTPTCSSKSLESFHPKAPARVAPSCDNLTVSFGKVSFQVNTDVPELDCLPLPKNYRVPLYGELGKDILHAAVALRQRRSLYLWGLPGSGKDALIHAWSALTRSPAKIFQVQPGVDIQHWMFSRGFNQSGTTWEEGDLLQAVRDGYVTTTGRRIPYLILLSDFDRADRSQAEYLRLIVDSIQGRVKGARGATYPVLPGTIIAATANTSGSGDTRGRMTSANVLDASLLDRFDRVFQFHWMDWKDEEPVLRSKFPFLVKEMPSAIPTMGQIIGKLREAIFNEDLHAEFSHRAVCNILGHAEDLVTCMEKVPGKLLKYAARAWVDLLPDKSAQDTAWAYMDPFFKGGALEEGDTSHIETGGAPLASF